VDDKLAIYDNMKNICPLLVFHLLVTWSATTALFIQPPYTTIPYKSLRLPTADRLGIPYRGIAYDAGDAASLPSFALSLNAEFGRLSPGAFKALRKAYSGWSQTRPQVTWQAEEEYTLLDFLPPLLQAVHGLYFQSSRSTQSNLPSFLGGPTDAVEQRTEQDGLLACNCWGFAWEVLFQADNKDTRRMTVSTADPTSAWRAFTGRGFDLLQSSRADETLLLPDQKLVRNRKLQAGDVLLIWHQIPGKAANSKNNLYLDHVAVVLDKDVYYEKSGSGDNTPFRITTWEGLTKNWPTSIFYWEWRRLRRNNLLPSTRGTLRPPRAFDRKTAKPQLQSASDTFGLDQQLSLIQNRRFFVLDQLRPSVAKLLSLTTEENEDGSVVEGYTYTGIWVLEELVFDPQTGRASLPPSAFTAEYMRLPPLPSNPYI
jgi:hypothetical protein